MYSRFLLRNSVCAHISPQGNSHVSFYKVKYVLNVWSHAEVPTFLAVTTDWNLFLHDLNCFGLV